MRWKLIILVLFLSLNYSCKKREDTLSIQDYCDMQKSKSDMPLILHLNLDRSIYWSADKIKYQITLINISDHTIILDTRLLGLTTLKIFNPSGEQIPISEIAIDLLPPNKDDCIALKPNCFYGEIDYVDLNSSLEFNKQFNKAGIYTFQAFYNTYYLPYPSNFEAWRGRLSSNIVRVRIFPNTFSKREKK